MEKARRIVLAVYVFGLFTIAGFLTPWERGIAGSSGLIPQTRTFGSLFDSPGYGGRVFVMLDVEGLAAEVGIWTLVAGTGWIFFGVHGKSEE